jgi:hypothetical protein
VECSCFFSNSKRLEFRKKSLGNILTLHMSVFLCLHRLTMPVWVARTDSPVYMCERGQGGGSETLGEGGDTKAGASPLELLSLDTHRRVKAGTHGAKGTHEMLHAETQMSITPKSQQACSAPDTVATDARVSPKQTSIQERPKIVEVLYFATACTRRSSSVLLTSRHSTSTLQKELSSKLSRK